jgi:hypothetical protein
MNLPTVKYIDWLIDHPDDLIFDQLRYSDWIFDRQQFRLACQGLINHYRPTVKYGKEHATNN